MRDMSIKKNKQKIENFDEIKAFLENETTEINSWRNVTLRKIIWKTSQSDWENSFKQFGT